MATYLMSLIKAIPVVPGSLGLTCPCNTPQGMNTHGLVKGWQAFFLRMELRLKNLPLTGQLCWSGLGIPVQGQSPGKSTYSLPRHSTFV